MRSWREDLEAIIDGRAPERIPAVFRLDPWYRSCMAGGHLPEELAGMSLEELEAYLGLARSARRAKVYETALHRPVECVQNRKGAMLITEWHTARRTLRMVQRLDRDDEAAGLLPKTIEYPIKTVEDYEAYEDVMRHREFIPSYEQYLEYDRRIGPQGLPMIVLGPVPIHDLLINWVGYEQGYLDLHDHPDVVLQAVETANSTYRRMWEIVAESPGRLVMHGVNFDTVITPPKVFREHFLPYIRSFNELMHGAGKKVAFHGDGDMSGLLELMLEADYDVADCFACEPMVRCTIARARSVWRERVTIWGGLPSVLLEPHVPLEQLRDHLEHVYRTVAPGDRFILGIADQALPTASWEHIKLVAQWVRDHSRYPINLPCDVPG